MLSHRLWVFLLFVLVFVSTTSLASDKKKLRARQSYFKAKLLYQQQQYKKAQKALRKAYRLDPDNTSYQNTLNRFIEEKPRQAAPKSSHHPTYELISHKILRLTNDGLFHSYNSRHSLSRKAFKQAMKLAQDAEQINNTLKSFVLNNMGCAIVMDQATCHNRKVEEKPHLTIPVSILHSATDFFIRALELFPGNKTARNNTETIYHSLDLLDQPGFEKYLTISETIKPGEAQKTNAAPKDNRATPSDRTSRENQNKNLGSYAELIAFLNTYDEIVLLIDNSLSMDEKISMTSPTRFKVMKIITHTLLLFTDEEVRIGAVSVSGLYCNQPAEMVFKVGEASRETLITAIDQIKLRGKTPLDLRMQQAVNLFTSDKNLRKMMLLYSDGINNCHGFNTCEIAASLRLNGIDVHVLSLLDDPYKYYKDFSVYDCITENNARKLWKIDHTGAIEQTENKIPISLYPMMLPATFEKLKCLDPFYHHTYCIPLPAHITANKEEEWIIK
ncbi:hypothetical protein MASR2M12_13300 [Bacteroidales bacterium]